MIRYLVALTLLLTTSYAYAKDYDARVITISDGDTIKIRTNNHRTVKVRLANIDAPEKLQPHGNESRQTLVNLTQGRVVTIHKSATDKYGRIVATVYRKLDDLNINREMVRTGNAWSYNKYLDDPSMNNLQTYAQLNNIGLWAESYNEAPWSWRHKQRQTKQPKF